MRGDCIEQVYFTQYEVTMKDIKHTKREAGGRAEGDPMNALTLIPRDFLDLSVSIMPCNDPHHAHENAQILTVRFTWRGAQIVIESEEGSGRFNVKIGDVSAVQLSEHAARMFLYEQLDARP
jgi:hypothetical protein